MKTINKAEYWFLDLVISGSYPLHTLIHPDLEIIANRDHHGLSHSELLRTLVNLFEDGSLIGVRYDDYTSIDFLPNYQEVDLALKGHDRMQYKLTTIGGKLWENLSNPNWDWYIADSSDSKALIIEAKYLHIAEQRLKMCTYIEQWQPILSSRNYQVLRPWQATYWKTLLEGHRIDCQIQDSRTSIRLLQDLTLEERDFLDKKSNWYTNPFK
jgi:hypothetical protein